VHAEAELEAADKQARAKMRSPRACRPRWRRHGPGRGAGARGRAAAIEKEGVAEARVIRQKLEAEAAGEEQKGLSLARVKEATAAALEKEGLAGACTCARSGREAGHRAGGRPGRRGRGHREEAAALVAEATGLAEKATAMKALDGVGREHEEFRLRLDKERAGGARAAPCGSTSPRRRRGHGAGHGAGQDQHRGRRRASSSTASSRRSRWAERSTAPSTTASRSLTDDVKQILSRPALSAQGVSSLTVSAVLASLLTKAGEGDKKKLRALLDKARELGLGDTPVGGEP
jgi:hypothetical protein